MKSASCFFIIIILSALCGGGCKSTGAVSEPAGLAGEYRDIEREIQQGQTGLAVTGERIEAGSRDIAEGLAALETSVAAIPESGDRERLVSQVRGLRVTAAEHQAEAERLNIQLAQERETSRKLSEKFNEYDQSSLALLSEKETEISGLREDKKKLTGQRNTLLAIVITAVLAAIVFIAVKVLRFFKVLPF